MGILRKQNQRMEILGVFNLAILNFGNTIYETFKSPDCKNKEVVLQMEELSEKFTKNSLFKKSEFEEESLWTLYSLQDWCNKKKRLETWEWVNQIY